MKIMLSFSFILLIIILFSIDPSTSLVADKVYKLNYRDVIASDDKVNKDKDKGNSNNNKVHTNGRIEKDPENEAKAIIEFKNSMAKRIHTYNSLSLDPWISAGGKERAKHNKERSFVQMINELEEISIDYTCNDQNKELENQSKKIVTRAREFSERLKKEPIDQVIEAWLKEQD